MGASDVKAEVTVEAKRRFKQSTQHYFFKQPLPVVRIRRGGRDDPGVAS